jgi:hypothetical protein
MERIINQAYAELITEAFSGIPDNILAIIQPIHFFTGTDPIYAGLLTQDADYEKGIMCYASIECQLHLPKSMRFPTIIMPAFPEKLGDIVHELGHALDDKTDWYIYETIPTPVTEYAKTDHSECFAEAFGSYLFWDYGNTKEIDEETLALFERLRSGEIF